MKMVFASHNKGKIKEVSEKLKSLHIEIIPQSELNVGEIAETGLTFIENAILKARHACQITGLPAIADDSGLEVTALQGAPGIFSARYAGTTATTQDNIHKLLQEMSSIPDHLRMASFRCVLVYLSHANDPAPLICEGIWHGQILRDTLGENGFGYDPIFFDLENQCTAAQLPLKIKNKISHRGKALDLLGQQLAEKLKDKS